MESKYRLERQAEMQLRWLPIKKLFVDWEYCYQRPPTAQRINKLVKNFDMRKLGVLLVGYRTDVNKYAVVDGSGRLHACLRINEDRSKDEQIKALPCSVIAVDDPRKEAELFAEQDDNVRRLSWYHKFNGAVMAGKKTPCNIREWLDAEGFELSQGKRKDRCAINFIKDLLDTWDEDAYACKTALVCQRKIALPTNSLSSDIHAGLFYLIRRGKLRDEHVEKLRKMGHSVVVVTMRNERAEAGNTMYKRSSARLAGAILVKILNHNARKNRIVWGPEDV